MWNGPEVEVVGDENGFEVGQIAVLTYDMDLLEEVYDIDLEDNDDWRDDNAESRYC
jgi:hypothetical protein